MHCPSCNGILKYFSKWNFKFGRVRECPHCSVKLKSSFNLLYFGIGLIPAVITHLYILGPVLQSFGVPNAFYVAQLITLFVFYTIIQQYKVAENPNKALNKD
jgi:hypothetical protein